MRTLPVSIKTNGDTRVVFRPEGRGKSAHPIRSRAYRSMQHQDSGMRRRCFRFAVHRDRQCSALISFHAKRDAVSGILTIRFDPMSQEHFEGMRQRYYPPERNLVPAHLTLFHVLPTTEEVCSKLAKAASTTTVFPIAVSAPWGGAWRTLWPGRWFIPCIACCRFRSRRSSVSKINNRSGRMS